MSKVCNHSSPCAWTAWVLLLHSIPDEILVFKNEGCFG